MPRSPAPPETARPCWAFVGAFRSVLRKQLHSTHTDSRVGGMRGGEGTGWHPAAAAQRVSFWPSGCCGILPNGCSRGQQVQCRATYRGCQPDLLAYRRLVAGFLPHITEGYDVVIGSRDIAGAVIPIRQPWYKMLAMIAIGVERTAAGLWWQKLLAQRQVTCIATVQRCLRG